MDRFSDSIPGGVLNGVFLFMGIGAPWKDLPQRYLPYQTCHWRFKQSVRQGVFRRIAQEQVEDLNERGEIDIREAFIDGSFAPAKKWVLLSARQSAAPRLPHASTAQKKDMIPKEILIECKMSKIPQLRDML